MADTEASPALEPEVTNDDMDMNDTTLNGDVDEDDDDIPAKSRRRTQAPAEDDDEEPLEEEPEPELEDGDDLFGEGDDAGDEKPTKDRQLDDAELDSGDDLDRTDRVPEDEDGEAPAVQPSQAEVSYADIDLPQAAIPEPTDGELYLLKVKYFSIDPHAWDHKTFQPPATDSHSKDKPSSTSSAYNTAVTTVRWRHSPSDPSKLQSNARILRWSDGTLTLQFASEPQTQYEIDAKPLAPPQKNPIIPTPVSLKATTKRKNFADNAPAYEASKDSFTYLGRSTAAGLVIFTNKVTAGLTVLQSSNTADEALEQLTRSLQAEVQGAHATDMMMKITEDPELAKRRAEQLEKDRIKAEKRREAAENRERERNSRVLGRHGLGGHGRMAGYAGGLGDEEGGAGARGPRGGRPKPRRARRNDFDDSDEDFKRGRTREDEYDEEDEFIAASDEEEEIVDDDDLEDLDEGIEVDAAEQRKRHKEDKKGGRERPRESPKRRREDVEDAPADGDADAEGEEVDDANAAVESTPTGGARAKRRRVIEDDDDDE